MASSWVDATVLHSVLSGLLVAVLGLWAFYGWVRLQQAWLLDQAIEALEAAADRGIALAPTGFRTRLVAQGEGLRLEWRTGVLGPRCVLKRGGQRRRLPLLRTARELDQALSPPQDSPAPD